MEESRVVNWFREEIETSYQGKREEVIPILQKIQREFGYLPPPLMEKVADFLNITDSELFGVASFYTQFRFQPVGKKRIVLCRGTACHVKGTPNIVEEVKKLLGIDVGETTPDGEYSLETVACMGCCALAPCGKINDRVVGKLTPEKIREILKEK